MDKTTLAAVATELAVRAGDLALDMQDSLASVREKGLKDVVTEADEACERLIMESILRLFPDHNTITEEHPSRRTGSDITWYIDPIDGTVNYSRGIPVWGVSIGVAWRGRMEAGVIRLPVTDETYTAVRGEGAFVNGKAIRVSPTESLADTIMASGDFNVGPNPQRQEATNRLNLAMFGRVAPRIRRIKCFGAAVAESAMVAAGRIEAYLMNNFNPWDVAAASLLVTEAGGKVSDIDGRPFALDGVTALFTNGHIHDALLETLTRRGPHD
jgi:myo-inositol-1(or 4)-monophosphatase